MYWGVAVFSMLCWVAFAALVGCYLALSVRRGRVQPGLWLAIGILSMSWMESPFDNATYAVFHPDFARLPAIGPIGMTQGGLPVIAPPGYVMYFLLPALLAATAAGPLAARFGWPERRGLLVTGLAVGTLWDGLIETVQAGTLRLWQFGRGTEGLTLFPGSTAQVPVLVFGSMGVFIMCATYLLGRRVGDGRPAPVLEAWVAGRVGGGARRTVTTLAAYVAAAHLAYLATFLPWAVARWGDLMAPGPVLRPYPEIPVQPAGPQGTGWLGTALIAGSLVASVAGVFVLARRLEAAVSGGAGARPATSRSPAAA